MEKFFTGSQPPNYIHPMVWTNPANGRKAIWIGQASTHRIIELEPEASKADLEHIKTVLYAPANVYTHFRTPGDLVIWSNRMVQHARMPFDPGQARTLRRTPIL